MEKDDYLKVVAFAKSLHDNFRLSRLAEGGDLHDMGLEDVYEDEVVDGQMAPEENPAARPPSALFRRAGCNARQPTAATTAAGNRKRGRPPKTVQVTTAASLPTPAPSKKRARTTLGTRDGGGHVDTGSEQTTATTETTDDGTPISFFFNTDIE